MPFVDVQSVLCRTATFTVARLLNPKELLIDPKPLLTNWEVLVEGLDHGLFELGDSDIALLGY